MDDLEDKGGNGRILAYAAVAASGAIVGALMMAFGFWVF